jgi:hypothetical protein
MGAWVRCSRGQLVYTGRISRAPFDAWATTETGRAAVDETASLIRFSLLGKTRAAARRLWRQLAAMARDTAVVTTIELEVQAYLQRLSELAFADGLPRGGVELRRLVVVPSVLLNGAAYMSLAKKLGLQPAFASLEGGDALREFFLTTLISEMEAAVASACPSPAAPLTASADWITVGMNSSFVWRVPLFQEPPWDGHHYVLELTRNPITRAVRKAVSARISSFEASLPSLSRAERHEMLRRARYGT